MASHCRISTVMKSDTDAIDAQLEKLVTRHNFVNQIKIVAPVSHSVNIKKCLDDLCLYDNTSIATLGNVVQFLLQLDKALRKDIKIVTLNRDITHQTSFCVANGFLTLKLDDETYHQSGFKFQLSSYSKGNRKFKNQMYLHSFDLLNFDMNTNDLNDVRLLWFMSNVDKTKYEIALTGESENAIEILKTMPLKMSCQKSSILIEDIYDCGLPDLEINKDEDDQNEIFDWLQTVGEVQPEKETDISMKPYDTYIQEPICIVGSCDVLIVIVRSTLISSKMRLQILRRLSQLRCWFGFAMHGVKHVLRSYGSKGEHGFLDDGSNDLLFYHNNRKSLTRKITDRSDPN